MKFGLYLYFTASYAVHVANKRRSGRVINVTKNYV